MYRKISQYFKQKLKLLKNPFSNLSDEQKGWLLAFVLFPFIIARRKRTPTFKEKAKYYKPTVHHTRRGVYTSWELRDKPLTDEELSA
jgi:hypothetical protein